MVTIGKATIKAKNHAFNQIIKSPLTSPILNMLIIKDIKHDIINAMKNENT